MGFHVDDDKPNKTQKKDIATEWAARLANLIRSKTKKRININGWVKEFRQLRNAVEDDEKIERVLEYIIVNYSQLEFKPNTVYIFTKYFDRFSAQAELDPTNNKLSPKAEQYTNELLEKYTWPAQAKKELGPAIEKSLLFMEEFSRKLKRVVIVTLEFTREHKKYTSGDIRASNFADELLHYCGMLRWQNFVWTWFEEVVWYRVKWKAFDVGLGRFTLGLDKPLFKMWLLETARKYSTRWDEKDLDKFLSIVESEQHSPM